MSKLITTLLISVFALSAYASSENRPYGENSRMSPDQRSAMRAEMKDYHESHPISQKHFEQLKKMDIERHQQHISQSQTALNCIQASSTPEAFKSCKEQERSARKEAHAQHKDMMEKMKERRQERREQMNDRRQ